MDNDEDSFIEFPINRTISTPINSMFYLSVDNCSFKSAEEEMISFFYKSMLKFIVDRSEGCLEESVESIPSGDSMFLIPNPKYTQVCDEEELMEKEGELIHDNYDDSTTFLTTSPSKRRTTSLLKRERRLPRRKSVKLKKKLLYSNTNTRNLSLNTPSQLKYQDDPDLEECVLVRFMNGNSYTGPLLMKMFHGIGEYKWKDGTVYKGDFVNGQMTGLGKFIYPDLSMYEGEVFNGYPHGYGKFFLRHSTAAYSGNWHLGSKHGAGCVHFDYNNWYDGIWDHNTMQGVGTRYYKSGSKYQGEFRNGKRHGHGCVVLWNNDFYNGCWENGDRNGFGQYIWQPYRNYCFCNPVRNLYIGMWKLNCMHGKGELNFGTPNGARYIGHFCFNEKHGDGIVICENGEVIESSPMFVNNKPLQYTSYGNFQSSECNDSVPPSIPVTPAQSRSWIPEQFEDRGTDSKFDIIDGKIDFRIEKKVFRFPSNLLDKESLAAINLCKIHFNRKMDKTYSIRIPWATSPESIDINPYIRQLMEMIRGCKQIDPVESFLQIPNSWDEVGVPGTAKQPQNYNYQEIYDIEEKALKRAINVNLRRLKQIYKQYSLIGCLKIVPFETIMNRLFLWQMYRDCKISEKGVSLTTIDQQLAEDSISFSESIHDPFENIYFWQFLTSLVKTAWEIYGSKTISYVFEGHSIWEQIFTKFLTQDIYPNVGHHTGGALFDYKDIIPLQSAYNWYKSIEEPMSVKTFVLNIFSLNRKEIQKFETPPKDFFIKNGQNVSIGNNVIFLEDEDLKYCIDPKREKVPPLPKKCYAKKLYFLHELPLKLIYKKIRTVIPGIFTNKECFNHEYKLCFLEFYEIILVCTQHSLRKKEQRVKKKIAKISENETVYLKQVTGKKSKQYRKSASSHHSINKRPTS